MGVLCRLCVAAAVLSLSAWYVSTPEASLKMLIDQSAVAQVHLQAFAESAAATFTEKSAVARALGSSTLVALQERLAVALVEGQALGSFTVHACGEHATAAKNQLQAFSASGYEIGGEYAAWAQAGMQSSAGFVAHQFHERFEVLSRYIADVPLAEMPGQLYDSSLPALKTLQASAVSTSRRFIHEVSTYDVSTFPDSCRALVASSKELSRSATPLQFAGGIILSMIATLVFARCLHAICCRRRGRVLTAPAAEANDARSEILLAPSPLRERFSQLPRAPTRRRRSESPGATAKENAGGASEVNREVAEQDVLHHINAATPEELRLISGLGDKSVNKILKYRSKDGQLDSLGDLVHKVGIHGATFANFAKAQGI